MENLMMKILATHEIEELVKPILQNIFQKYGEEIGISLATSYHKGKIKITLKEAKLHD